MTCRASWICILLLACAEMSDRSPGARERDAAMNDDAAVAEREAGSASNAGSCSNLSDEAILGGDPPLDVDAVVRPCVMPRVLAGSRPGSDGFREGVADCLTAATGLSNGCATCYARHAECSFPECGVICLPDPGREACKDCRCGRTSDVDCFAELDDCTGLPSDQCE